MEVIMRSKRPSGITPQPQPEQKYRTQTGDTLRLIASKFQLNPEALRSANNLKQGIDDKLRAGRELVIPARQIIDTLIKPKRKGVAGVKADIVKAAQRTNPFEADDVIKGDIGDEPWSEWDPYDPDTNWSEGAPSWKEGKPSGGDEVINPADLNIKNIKRKLTKE